MAALTPQSPVPNRSIVAGSGTGFVGGVVVIVAEKMLEIDPVGPACPRMVW